MNYFRHALVLMCSFFWVVSLNPVCAGANSYQRLETSRIQDSGYDILQPPLQNISEYNVYVVEVLNRLSLIALESEISSYISMHRDSDQNYFPDAATGCKWLSVLFRDGKVSSVRTEAYDNNKYEDSFDALLKNDNNVDVRAIKGGKPHFSEWYASQLRKYIEGFERGTDDRRKRLYRPSAVIILDVVQERLDLSDSYFKSRIRKIFLATSSSFQEKVSVTEGLALMPDKRLSRYAMKYFEKMDELGRLNMDEASEYNTLQHRIK